MSFRSDFFDILGSEGHFFMIFWCLGGVLGRLWRLGASRRSCILAFSSSGGYGGSGRSVGLGLELGFEIWIGIGIGTRI